MGRFLGYLVIFALVFALVGCGSPQASNSNSDVSETGQYATADQAVEAGIKYLEGDETDKAIETFDQAVALDPSFADAYFYLGVAHALIETRDATALSETTDTSSGNTSDSTKPNSQVNFEKAVDAYKARIAANADDAPSHYGLGRSLNKLNKDNEARKALQEAVEKSPENVTYIIAFGLILMKLAQYPEAVVQFKKVLELDPGNIEAEEHLADALAGRTRVRYTTTPKPSPSQTPASNSANTNSQTPPTSTPSKQPTPAKPTPTPSKPPTNRP